jgi:hypothetical protein
LAVSFTARDHASHRESADQRSGRLSRLLWAIQTGTRSISVSLPLPTSITRRVSVWSTNARRLLSGDHCTG